MAASIEIPADNLPDSAFTSITQDSRRVEPGSLFVATVGENVDSHDFAEQAREKGAVAILGERAGLERLAGLPYLRTSNVRRDLALIAHRLAGSPSEDMTVIGVTGTNGKSSTVTLINRVLGAAGMKTACFGTLGYSVGEAVHSAPHTTPFAEDLADLFRQAREADHSHVVMEVSSHALEQDRVAGIEFNGGVFMNLTQDHLDYHETMHEYLREKRKLFERIEGEGGFTVVNKDDPVADEFIQASSVPCYTFGAEGDCRATHIRAGLTETIFNVASPWGETEINMRLLGRHNVSNVLAVIAVCGALGVPLDDIAASIAATESVPGRFERIDVGQPFQVIVDYAHTDDALLNALKAARDITNGRLIVAFGCGGDRDKTKRPKMAAVAAEWADYSIITSDNPRSESPERIALDVEAGMQHAGKKRDDDYDVILDRGEAIRRALERANPGDLVLLAGKGHEDYQILKTGKIHFDDREVARNLLEAM